MWSSAILFQGKAEIKKAQLRSAPQPTAKPSAVVWESLGPEHRGGRLGGACRPWFLIEALDMAGSQQT